MDKMINIHRHILQSQRMHPEASGEFSILLTQIALAAKVVSREVNKAGLGNILGRTGETNVQGEEVQKLDRYANEMFYQILARSGQLCIMGSEEDAEPMVVPKQYQGNYALNIDPLDGSSNIDANVSIGTIFTILRKVSRGPEGSIDDLLQPGNKIVAAGYIIYGSGTLFVYSAGAGVHAFTLDQSIGEFLLSHIDIKTPTRGRIYSINEGNYQHWDSGIRQYIKYLQVVNPESGRPYSARYIGSLVADFHRNLLYGGIFCYPADRKHKNGKLRLLFEGAPMAYLAEQAGGAASDGHQRVLDIVPDDLHQRIPLIVGSKEDVEEAVAFIKGERTLEPLPE